jgi:hypothetical protein
MERRVMWDVGMLRCLERWEVARFKMAFALGSMVSASTSSAKYAAGRRNMKIQSMNRNFTT